MDSKPVLRADLMVRVQSQIDRRTLNRDEKFLRNVFDRLSESGRLPHARVPSALQEVDAQSAADELAVRFRRLRIKDNVGLTFEEFKQIATKESKLEEWARELPLAELVADGLSAFVHDNQPEPLRPLSKMSIEDITIVAEGLVKGLQGMLAQRIQRLQASLKAMDDKAAAKAATDVAAKFATSVMSAGGIDDYHSGIEGRTGTRSFLNFLFACGQSGGGVYFALCSVAQEELKSDGWYRNAASGVREGHGGGALPQDWVHGAVHDDQLQDHDHGAAGVELHRRGQAVSRHAARQEDARH